MDYHKLEIVLHSAKGLYDVKNFGTMNPYVLFWIAGDGESSEKYKTNAAVDGGSYPVWNCGVEFNFDSLPNNYYFFFEIKHDGTLFDRDIGHGHVPLKDLLTGDAAREKVSYPVRTPSGHVNGEIILSFRFTKLRGLSCTDTSRIVQQENELSIAKVAIKVVSIVFELLDLPPIDFLFSES